MISNGILYENVENSLKIRILTFPKDHKNFCLEEYKYDKQQYHYYQYLQHLLLHLIDKYI